MSTGDELRAIADKVDLSEAALAAAHASISDRETKIAELQVASLDQRTQIADLTRRLDVCEHPILPLTGGLRHRDDVVAASPYGTVVKDTWAHMQQVRGGPLDLSRIEAAIAHGATSFRPIMGAYSPRFVKDLVGTYVHHTPTTPVGTFDSPCWWRTLALDLAEEFYAQLAEAIDDRVEIVYSSGAQSGPYAEQFVRGFADQTTRTNVLAKGYTPEADKAALRRSAEMMSVFTRSHVGCSFNGWQYAKTNPRGSSIQIDGAFTAEMMDVYRELGPGTVLQNNSIRSDYLDDIDTAEAGTYAAMLERGGPIAFQTAQPSKIGDEAAVLAWCVDVGAFQVELPHPSSLSAAELSPFDAALKANA